MCDRLCCKYMNSVKTFLEMKSLIFETFENIMKNILLKCKCYIFGKSLPNIGSIFYLALRIAGPTLLGFLELSSFFPHLYIFTRFTLCLFTVPSLSLYIYLYPLSLLWKYTSRYSIWLFEVK